MSVLNTKPRWCPTAVATNQGWVNSVSGELLVSFRNLKQRLDEEQALSTPTVVEEEVIAPVVQAVKEVRIRKPKKNQQIIGETVEFDNVNVVGE